MTPIYQTIGGIGGNCFQACLASVFDLPLDACPHLFQNTPPDGIWTQGQWDAVVEFSELHGRDAVWLDPDIESDRGCIREIMKGDTTPCIATGKSPSGDFGHNVVMLNGTMVHDPALGMGLAGDAWIYFVFPLKPKPDGRQ